MNLSTAITQGNKIAPHTGCVYVQLSGPDFNGDVPKPASCPLGAAYLGTLSEAALPHFWAYTRSVSDEALCSALIRHLHRAFPHLGQTVRSWPRLAGELEQRGLLPRIRPYQSEHRQEVHKSLWKAITDLHDRGMTKGEIAAFLGGHGL